MASLHRRRSRCRARCSARRTARPLGFDHDGAVPDEQGDVVRAEVDQLHRDRVRARAGHRDPSLYWSAPPLDRYPAPARDATSVGPDGPGTGPAAAVTATTRPAAACGATLTGRCRSSPSGEAGGRCRSCHSGQRQMVLLPATWCCPFVLDYRGSRLRWLTEPARRPAALPEGMGLGEPHRYTHGEPPPPRQPFASHR